jgi:hypothetical protein
MSADTGNKRKLAIAGAVAFAVLASVAAIGVPKGWYSRAKNSTAASQPTTAAATIQPPIAEAPSSELAAAPESTQPSDHADEAAQALRRQRDKEKERAKAREEKAAALTQAAPGSASPAPASAVPEAVKAGPKKITVTVTYDESGRVTQASGGDASAVRIARQKRFPAGKAGSATITIPIN